MRVPAAQTSSGETMGRGSRHSLSGTVTCVLVSSSVLILGLPAPQDAPELPTTGPPAAARVVSYDAALPADTCCGNPTVYTMIDKVMTSDYIDTSKVLARCTAVSENIDCSISETVTTSVDVGLALGASREWATAEFRGTWGSSQAVAVTCGQRNVKKGQTLVAHPQGTRYTYRITSGDALGVAERKTSESLTAFNPNPSSIACNVVG
jgi:hypothetical protein